MLDGGQKLPGAFKILHGSFVLFRRLTTAESAQVPTFARFRVLFSRIEPVFTGF
jgi:hypothetical protein